MVLGLVVTILAMVAVLWCTLRIQERGAEAFLNHKTRKNLGYCLIAIATASIIYGIVNLSSAIIYAILGLLLGLQLLRFAYTLIRHFAGREIKVRYFMVLLQKFGLAFAIFLVDIALQLSGFIERIPGEAIPQQPDSALLAIRIAIAPLPTVTLIIGIILAYFYPITKEFHEEIRFKLQEQKHVSD